MKDEKIKVGEVEQIVGGLIDRVPALKKQTDEEKKETSELITLILEQILKATDIPIDKPRKFKRESRATRYGNAQGLISEAKGEFESLRDELQEWHDNLPENLQSGSKADALQEAVDNLETAIQSAEEAEGVDVEFPGMFG